MAGNRSVLRAQELVIYKCTLCDSEDRVRWFCNDCQETLCDRCKEAHQRGKKTKNDKVVSIGKASRQGDQPEPEVCKLHPGKLCDMYCSDCKSLICSVCLSLFHKPHTWTHFEDELTNKKHELDEHLAIISTKIERIKNETTKEHHVNNAFKNNIDSTRQELTLQRTKVKNQVDSIADTMMEELSSVEEIETTRHVKCCQQSEKTIRELERLFDKANTAKRNDISLFELVDTLRETVPLYDVNVNDVLPKQPTFIPGSIKPSQLTKMMGEIYRESQYKKIDIDSTHVRRLSMFTVTQRARIWGICPIDDNHAWLSIRQHMGLVLVNRNGVVTDTVGLDFHPCLITMLSSTEILMTRYRSTLVYKLSLSDKQVTIFTDVSVNNPWGISVSDNGEVFVSTITPDVLVLSQSCGVERKFSCGTNGKYIACFPSEYVAIAVAKDLIDRENAGEILITDKAGTAIQRWAGELDSGQKVGKMHLCDMSCDNYNRLFVPDFENNQVYVLPRDGKQATCLLDKTHGVVKPTAVAVDTCGDVWIGSKDGTVHVMRL